MKSTIGAEIKNDWHFRYETEKRRRVSEYYIFGPFSCHDVSEESRVSAPHGDRKVYNDETEGLARNYRKLYTCACVGGWSDEKTALRSEVEEE